MNVAVLKNIPSYWLKVGVATRYGPDGRGSNPGGEGIRFTAHVQTGPGEHPASCAMGNGVSCMGIKRPGPVVNYPPPYNAEVKERVELYVYSSGFSWPVLRRPLPSLYWLKLRWYWQGYFFSQTWGTCAQILFAVHLALVLRPLCFNAPCQFTPLVNLFSRSFCLTPFGCFICVSIFSLWECFLFTPTFSGAQTRA
jgi:hypothetical protein